MSLITGRGTLFHHVIDQVIQIYKGKKARVIRWRVMVLEEFITVSSDHYQKGDVVVVLESSLKKKMG